MLAFKTLSFLYTKYFFIIIIALCAFIVGFDLLDNSAELPSSANLTILYIMYKAFYAIDLMLPLSLVFAVIASLVSLIRTNTFGVYYALGYSKAWVILPFLSVTIFFVLVHIALHFSDFSKANEYANNIKDASKISKPTENLFFAYDGSYIYFEKLYPLSKHAQTIRVFTFKDNYLTKQIEAKDAVYKDDSWVLRDVTILYPPSSFNLGGSGYKKETLQEITVLKDFKPKIIDQVYEGKANFSVLDGYEALRVLENQNIDLLSIKNSIYKVFISPWFAVFMVMIIFTYAPISSRFMSLSKFSFGAILASLLLWGVLYVLGELSLNKVIATEIGLFLPMVMLMVFTTYRLLFSKQI